MSLLKNIAEIMERDLKKCMDEVNAYPDEQSLWTIREGISNSGGNLCLHLVGNLNHFIGATLGNTGYVRHREIEFSSKDVPRAVIVGSFEATIVMVKQVLASLPAGTLEKDFPLELNGKTLGTEYMLLHLLAHLSYHLGQINYHRRLVAGIN